MRSEPQATRVPFAHDAKAKLAVALYKAHAEARRTGSDDIAAAITRTMFALHALRR